MNKYYLFRAIQLTLSYLLIIALVALLFGSYYFAVPILSALTAIGIYLHGNTYQDLEDRDYRQLEQRNGLLMLIFFGSTFCAIEILTVVLTGSIPLWVLLTLGVMSVALFYLPSLMKRELEN